MIMILHDKRIESLVAENHIGIDPYNPYTEDGHFNQLQPASYDLKIGRVVRAGNKLDIQTAENNSSRIIIEAHNWALVESKEIIKLPLDICASYGVTSSVARSGLIQFGGPQIDPGYNGKIYCQIFNPTLADVVIDINKPFFTMIFYQLTDKSQGYMGENQGQREFKTEDLQRMLTIESKDFSKVIKTVDRLETGMLNLQADVHEIKEVVTIAKPFLSKLSNIKKYAKWITGLLALIAFGMFQGVLQNIGSSIWGIVKHFFNV